MESQWLILTDHTSPPRLFTKLVLEAPIITESALEVIRRYCEDEVSDAGAGSARLGPTRPGW